MISKPRDAIEANQITASRWSREKGNMVRDIGPPPDVVNPVRRERSKYDLKYFLGNYFPKVFYLPWSNDHLLLIKTVESIIIEGGKVCVAMPRGSGKTSIFQHAIIWSVLHAHQRFPILLCSDAKNYARLLAGIKVICETNRLLLEDYPEVIHPVASLEHVALRAINQTCCSRPTYLKWGAGALQLATTEWSVEAGNAGACIGGGGLTSSAIRGQVMALPNGEQIRPSCALVDDPQTRRIARSDTMVQDMEEVVKGDICGMAGPDTELSLMMTCTVIHMGDLADRIMDNKRTPQIKTIRVATLKSFPQDMKMWETYADLRRREQLEEMLPGSANKFYLDNRELLDAGCDHYWPERIPKGYASAIEASLAEYFDDPRSFMSERQNNPEERVDESFTPLNPTHLAMRVSPYERNTLPHDVEKITAFIDVQDRMLFWSITGWSKSFGGYVLDYGCWPKQRRRHFIYSEIKAPTLQTEYRASSEDSIRMGLIELLKQLTDREWVREQDQATMRIERGLVDAGYKYDVIEAALLHGRFSNIWVPCRGVGIGAKETPLKLRANARGMGGMYWVQQKPRDRYLTSVFSDVNYWKTAMHDSLSLPITHPSAVLLFKALPSDHQMFADHCTAEASVSVQANGRKINEWSLKERTRDNHWWDCLVGTAVAASVAGIRRPGELPADQPIRSQRRARAIKF